MIHSGQLEAKKCQWKEPGFLGWYRCINRGRHVCFRAWLVKLQATHHFSFGGGKGVYYMFSQRTMETLYLWQTSVVLFRAGKHKDLVVFRVLLMLISGTFCVGDTFSAKEQTVITRVLAKWTYLGKENRKKDIGWDGGGTGREGGRKEGRVGAWGVLCGLKQR